MQVMYQGSLYPATDVSRGAAYELFADHPVDGFTPNPRGDARLPFRRFVHRSEVSAPVAEQNDEDDGDQPLLMPVSRTVDWSAVHRMSQATEPTGTIAAIRRSAAIRRG